MNIHHLELFYYVARHRGITEAVRNIPYGIQQPAVSGQVAQLEEYLGVTLFQRRPFSLTPAGEKLFRFIQPFFSSLDTIAADLQAGKARHIRIGASTIVLRDHLPGFLHNIRKKFPGLKVSLREGYQAELETMLQREEIDLAITLMERKSSSGIQALPLIDLSLALLVEKSSPITTPEQLWKLDKIADALICLPHPEAICRHFQQGLAKLGVDWFTSLEVSSIDLIETYVGNGFGIGVTVVVPRSEIKPNLRALPLSKKEFDPVVVGALWRGKPSVLVQTFVAELQLKAAQLSEPAARA